MRDLKILAAIWGGGILITFGTTQSQLPWFILFGGSAAFVLLVVWMLFRWRPVDIVVIMSVLPILSALLNMSNALTQTTEPVLQNMGKLGGAVISTLGIPVWGGLVLVSLLFRHTDWYQRLMGGHTKRQRTAILEGTDRPAKRAVIEHLGENNNQQAIDELLAVVRHPDPEVGHFALTRLFSLRADDLLDSLMRLQSKATPAVQEMITQELIARNITARGVFNQADSVYDADVEEGVVNTLLHWDRSVVELVLDTLRNREASSRAQMLAVRVLGARRERAALSALLAALTGARADVRLEAALALGQLGDTAAVPALIQALQDDNTEVCAGAAWALGDLGDPTAVPALQQRREDTGEDGNTADLREAITAALARLPPRRSDATIAQAEGRQSHPGP